MIRPELSRLTSDCVRADVSSHGITLHSLQFSSVAVSCAAYIYSQRYGLMRCTVSAQHCEQLALLSAGRGTATLACS
jgi:hypothetical protein